MIVPLFHTPFPRSRVDTIRPSYFVRLNFGRFLAKFPAIFGANGNWQIFPMVGVVGQIVDQKGGAVQRGDLKIEKVCMD